MRPITTASLFALLAVFSSVVHSTEDVKIDLQVHLVQMDTNGQEVFKPARQANPGDILQYKVICRNQGDTLARDVMATLPVPAKELVFVKDKSDLQNLQASMDGSVFGDLPLKKISKTPDGRILTVDADPADYRFLRWSVGDIPAKKSATMYARMRVAPGNNLIAGGQQ
ncbi:MAG: hypothetical protein KJ798_04160 [Gammaproteobacteria bacterium]|uniref:hypothetical protein n=1 Tax=Limnobacter sp. TaxID=2003368 RepID=UPI001DC9501F|nr:hypothetical protein [Limnobacter sp.]MBU0782832.1 hypothetical protein [Gammaproteobacteria bacterium]MBU0849419.1 hypothetical protein [Gammaproteobacteria bacterium]MBU1266570.1 hypothetical protein [Gammaproteobacteria bacterium]MBU1527767.1 hypothetical protein [Gammaproteobacteria bacterium]MBU1779560.1 hypothetical protein [Gammaproteobacteria bacterium]